MYLNSNRDKLSNDIELEIENSKSWSHSDTYSDENNGEKEDLRKWYRQVYLNHGKNPKESYVGTKGNTTRKASSNRKSSPY